MSAAIERSVVVGGAPVSSVQPTKNRAKTESWRPMRMGTRDRLMGYLAPGGTAPRRRRARHSTSRGAQAAAARHGGRVRERVTAVGRGWIGFLQGVLRIAEGRRSGRGGPARIG